MKRSLRPSLIETCLVLVLAVLIVLGIEADRHSALAYAGFIQDAAVPAQASQRETGVPASVTIAQAIQESQWGDKHIGDANNYFGIKAFEQADGSIYIGPVAIDWVWADTFEYVNGEKKMVKARFRKYASMADSFTDHGYFFWENPRYHPAFEHKADPRAFARQIAAAGYATDPNYANSLIKIMEDNNLFQYDVPGERPPDEDVPGVVVDDRGANAQRGGTADYWQEVGIGHQGHSLWTYVAQSKLDNHMYWKPSLPAAGDYEVLVYIPPIGSTTGQAKYVIKHAGVEDAREISQRDHSRQWVSLGTYNFAAAGDESVYLSDATGERDQSAKIAFDAVRFVSTEPGKELDAVLAGSPHIAVAYVQADAELTLEVKNKGQSLWKIGRIVLVNISKPLEAGKTQPLTRDTAPGEVVTWTITVQAPKGPGVVRSDWQLEQDGESFGPKLSAYLVVLPEGASKLKEQIESKIEEWRQAGEQKIEEFIDQLKELIEREVQSFIEQLIETIKREVQRFLEKLIQDLTSEFCGVSSLLVLLVICVWWCRR